MGALAGEVGAVTPTPATTTSAPGPSLTTTTSGGPVLPTTSSQCPLTCCQFGAIPSTGYTDFTITMDYQFNRFDCAAFKGTLANQMVIPDTQLVFVSCIAGSVILRAGAPVAAATRLETQVRDGTSAIPITQYSSGGTVVTPPNPFPFWIVAISAMFIIVVALVIILLVLRARKNRYRSTSTVAFTRSEQSRYAPLEEMPIRTASSRADDLHLAPAAARPSNSEYVTTQLLTDVVDKGENILDAKRGDIAFILPEDWKETGEWVYAKVGLRTGFVPRSYLILK